MVAYSFKRMFVPALLTKRKIGTIRAERKRHARPGEEVQLYQGMRTKSCTLIGRARCQHVWPIWLDFQADQVHVLDPGKALGRIADLDVFAQGDGFDDWSQLRSFWCDVSSFYGCWIVWNDTLVAAL